MPASESSGAPESRRKARRTAETKPPIDYNVTPPLPSAAARLDLMTRERIEALEADKSDLAERVKQLRREVDTLRPENARLNEALDNVQVIDLVAGSLIALGGTAVSYAAFVGSAAPILAGAGGAGALAGVALLAVSA